MHNVLVILIATAAAFTPSQTSQYAWQSTTYGVWFDPLTEFGYDVPQRDDKPLLLYLPPLEGNCLAAFAQFPKLGADYEILALSPRAGDTAAASDWQGSVDAIAAFVERESTSRDVYVCGESYGGCQALAVGIAARPRGVVAVNPATPRPERLAELAERMKTMSNIEFALTSLSLATRVGDPTQTRTILSTLWDNPMKDPKRCAPALAAYFERVLPPFVEGFNAPRPFFEARLAALGIGAAELENTLESLDVSLLVVAGDVDRLVGSAEEAPRIASVVGDAQIHMVHGAGHSGTLDQRRRALGLRVQERRGIRQGRQELAKGAKGGPGGGKGPGVAAAAKAAGNAAAGPAAGARRGAAQIKALAAALKRDREDRTDVNAMKRLKPKQSALAEALRLIGQPGGYPRALAACGRARGGRVAACFARAPARRGPLLHAFKPEALLDDARVVLCAALARRVEDLNITQLGDVAFKVARPRAAGARRPATPAEPATLHAADESRDDDQPAPPEEPAKPDGDEPAAGRRPRAAGARGRRASRATSRVARRRVADDQPAPDEPAKPDGDEPAAPRSPTATTTSRRTALATARAGRRARRPTPPRDDSRADVVDESTPPDGGDDLASPSPARLSAPAATTGREPAPPRPVAELFAARRPGNIFDELRADRGVAFARPPDAWKGDLTNWALREDVLLLNAALTYCEDDKKGQQKKGWEIVTREVVRVLNERLDFCVFLAWGKDALELCDGVDRSTHEVIATSHPSPLSVTRGPRPFAKSRCFSRVNAALADHGKPAVVWPWARTATTTAGDGGKPAPPKRRRSKGPKGPGHRPNPKKSKKPKVKVKVATARDVAAVYATVGARPAPRLKSRAARDITALLRYQTEMRRVDGDDGGDGGDGDGDVSEPDEGSRIAAQGTTFVGIPGEGIVQNSKTVDAQEMRVVLFAAARASRPTARRRGGAPALTRGRRVVARPRPRRRRRRRGLGLQSAFVEDASALQLIVTTIVAGESAARAPVSVSRGTRTTTRSTWASWPSRAEVARPSDEDPPPMVSFPQVACDECRATYCGFARVFDATAGDFCRICPKKLPPACRVSVYSWKWTRPAVGQLVFSALGDARSRHACLGRFSSASNNGVVSIRKIATIAH
ncbi:1-acylglycerol-3-phosphate O-acyltransferase [Aureococcus anophagefferens]|nr:1-acylglycerol-3-phosphate O-acyltransferase [Aureococcus anophagefferens]